MMVPVVHMLRPLHVAIVVKGRLPLLLIQLVPLLVMI